MAQGMKAISPVVVLVVVALIVVAGALTYYLLNEYRQSSFHWHITGYKIKATWSGYATESTDVPIFGLYNPDLGSITDTWDGKAVAVKGIATLNYGVLEVPWRLGVYTGTKGLGEPWWSGDYYIVKITDNWHSDWTEEKTETDTIWKVEYDSELDIELNLGVSVNELIEEGYSIHYTNGGKVQVETSKYYVHHIVLHLSGIIEKWHKDNPWSKHKVGVKYFDETSNEYEVITLWKYY